MIDTNLIFYSENKKQCDIVLKNAHEYFDFFQPKKTIKKLSSK
jgi:hypothetical protein